MYNSRIKKRSNEEYENNGYERRWMRKAKKLGHGILTSYAHIIYGKWNKISGFGRILNG